jgi:hypothetical protein
MLVNLKKLNLKIGKWRFQTRNFPYTTTLGIIKNKPTKIDSRI